MNKVILFVLIGLSSFAQQVDSTMLVFPWVNQYENERFVLSAGTNGFAMFDVAKGSFRSKERLLCAKYSTNFKLEWTATFEPDQKYELVTTYQSDSIYYELFQEPETSKIGVFWVNLVEGTSDFVEGNMLTSKEVTHFKVIDSKAILGGDYNERPVVVIFNMVDKTSKVLSNIHADNLFIRSLEVDPTKDEVWVVLGNRRDCTTTLRSFGLDGKPHDSRTIGGRNNHILSSTLLKTKDGNQIVVGNYATECTDYSRGIYTYNLSSKDNTPADFKLYPFYQLSNFYNYLPARKKEKLKLKIQKKEERGLPNYQKFKMNLHDLYSVNDQNVIVGEFYYPETRNTSTFSNFNSRYALNRAGLTYLKYTHAVVLGMSETGQILWDNSISLTTLSSDVLEDKVQLNAIGDKLLIGYPVDGKILLSSIKGGITITNNEKVFVTGRSSYLKDEPASLTAWYGNNFLVWGKKEGLNGDKQFFITKLSYAIQ